MDFTILPSRGVKVHFHAVRQTMSFDFDCFK
ncbi:hypothetical protein IFM89_038094, partial [Coptis chinensis]